MNFAKYKSDVVLIAHFLLGIAAGLLPALVFYWVLLIFFVGVYCGFTKSSAWPAYIFATYLAGIELLGRMSASGLPHEFIKYAVTVILLIELFLQQKEVPKSFIFFIVLLIPGTLLTDGGNLEETRQMISANLSGPVCLAVSAVYFYNRILYTNSIQKLFLYVLYPLAAVVGYLVIKTPDFSEIEFGFKSNFETSIYGPNQMSSILGLGILIIGLAYFLKIRLFGSYVLTLAYLGILLFRGLLTFSRGGMITPAILLFVVFLYFSWKTGGFNRSTLRILALAAIVVALAIVSFDYTNKLTSNALYNRYTGVKNGKQIEDIDKLTSGRTMIVYLDWQIFQDNSILGVGVGMGKFFRARYGYYVEVIAHNEFSRMLAEHGLLGIAALLILVFAPVTRFFSNRNVFERIMIISFTGFCFVFMTHAATRIAAPCFLYGFAFVRIVPALHRLRKNDFVSGQHAFTPRQISSPDGVNRATA